jgi:hypothetical protein
MKSRHVDIRDFTIDGGKVICTTDSLNGVVVDSAVTGTSTINFPARSITTISLQGNVMTAVHDQQLLNPAGYSLSQNFPNPFNPSTVIEYSLPSESFVSLKVCDLLGREVALLVNGIQQSGTHKITFNCSGNSQGVQMASGVYFYTISAHGFEQTRKMLFLK